MAPFVLKFKGNKSFSPLGQISDSDTLTRTWKVCTKVAAHLEQGQRLENLSWRLWFLQCALVQSDNAKSKREFKKLSKSMSDKLDKDKGRSITELEAPNFKRTDSTDKVRARVEEMERNREQGHGKGAFSTGTGMRGMQYTFALDPNIKPLATTPALNDLPSSQGKMRIRTLTQQASNNATNEFESHNDMDVSEDHHSLSLTIDHEEGNGHQTPTPLNANVSTSTSSSSSTQMQGVIRFPTIFSSDFGPAALLCASPTTSPSLAFAETAAYDSNSGTSSGSHYSNRDTTMTTVTAAFETPSSAHQFGISRPVFEFPLEEILKAEGDSGWESDTHQWTVQPSDIHQGSSSTNNGSNPSYPPHATISTTDGSGSSQSKSSRPNPSATPPERVRSGSTNSSSTITSTNPGAVMTGHLGNPGNTAPGGVKSECANCGATHTPLWRRGLNDELNCNACGLYCKLHKRARPKNLRTSHGDRAGTAWGNKPGEADVVGEPVQCHNCATMATPLWRKDDEGNTLCNACGLYLKLHGTKRPLSMKSDVIRKRSRHETEKRSSISSLITLMNPTSNTANTQNSRRNSPTPPPPSAGSSSSASDAFIGPSIGPNGIDGISYPYSPEYTFPDTEYLSPLVGMGMSLANNLSNDLSGYSSYGNYGPFAPEPSPTSGSNNHGGNNSNQMSASGSNNHGNNGLSSPTTNGEMHQHILETTVVTNVENGGGHVPPSTKRRRLTAESSFSGSSLAHSGTNSTNSSPTGLGPQAQHSQSPPYFMLDTNLANSSHGNGNNNGNGGTSPTQANFGPSSPTQSYSSLTGVTYDFYGYPIHPPMVPLHPPSLIHPYSMTWCDPPLGQLSQNHNVLNHSQHSGLNRQQRSHSRSHSHSHSRSNSQHMNMFGYDNLGNSSNQSGNSGTSGHNGVSEEEMFNASIHADLFADQQDGSSGHGHVHYQQGGSN